MPMISSSSSLSLLSPLCYQMPPLRFSWRSINVSRLELAGQFGNPLIQDLIRADSGLELAGPPSPLLSSFPFSSSCSLLSCFVASFYSMVDVFLATRMNNV
ncbi:hypothetical protein POPTR_017G120050v4 [Populus trichocarpa]|uniref:Uncharacterized protein n=1 Tax=Populus trichocarpa TaxID=3694 RepID=A0ACC0RQR0_POPTR|nr:hypothetical protein POPTR_017G120050v4 [Populus trichocarpa]